MFTKKRKKERKKERRKESSKHIFSKPKEPSGKKEAGILTPPLRFIATESSGTMRQSLPKSTLRRMGDLRGPGSRLSAW
jgi:hypothetical protein